MANDTLYSISELAALAGVTPRTIRYYTAEGLLPGPDTRGPYARYGHAHLLRLQLIARLKAAYLPLAAIKERIEQLGEQELAQLLAELAPAPPPPPTSASDYLAEVLGRMPAPQRLAEAPARYEALPAPAFGLADAAAPRAPAAPQMIAPAPAPPPPAPQPRLGPAAALEQRWRRITLAPGVELHISEAQYDALGTLVERLVALGRALLGRKESEEAP